MDITSYGYVVLVAALGMSIVFLFLWFLSGLMRAISRAFGDRAAGSAEPAAEQDEEPAAGTRLTSKSGVPDTEAQTWLVPAVVAFLQAEARDTQADPGPWTNTRNAGHDPWLNAPPRSYS